MMKKIKVISSILFLVCLVSFVFQAQTKVYAYTSSDLVTIEGAQVRTTGNAGIRFVGKSEYIPENDLTITGYGIVLGYGKCTVNEEFVIGSTINGKETVTIEVTEKDEQNRFYGTLYGILESIYTLDISSRAYIRLSDNSIIYSSNIKVRSLAQVVVAAHDDIEYVEEENLVKTVYDTIERINATNQDLNNINNSNTNVIVDDNINTTKKYVLVSNDNTLIDDYKFFKQGTNAFSSINDAITSESVLASSIVYVFNGTYSDDLIINKSLSIIGANYNTSGNSTRVTETVITGLISISASNVEINGVATTGNSRILLSSNNINIKNIVATYDGVKNTDYIMVDSAINDLLIHGCKINLTSTSGFVNISTFLATNVTITNNHVSGYKRLVDNVEERTTGIKIQRIDGEILIRSNTIDGFDLYPIYLGSAVNTCSQIDIINNVFTNGGNSGAVLGIKAIKDTTIININYNTFENSMGSIVCNLNGTMGNNKVKFMYNKFMDKINTTLTRYIANNTSSGPFIVDKNYFASTPSLTNVMTSKSDSITNTYTLVDGVPTYSE